MSQSPPPPLWRESAVVGPPQASPRRPSGVVLPVVLAAATAVTSVLAGAMFSPDSAQALRAVLSGDPRWFALGIARFLTLGAPYAAAVMVFFMAHEMGHYLACRYYRVEATLPYFFPFPLPLLLPNFGTFGAVIRIKGPIPHRRALFDIGVAGPIAGFAVAVPLLIVGTLQGAVVPPEPGGGGTLTFGDSLLTYLLVSILRPEARQMELAVGPLFIAGWLGLLATAMNLIPAGQLDGGHIIYALAPRWHRQITLASGAFLASLVVTRGLVHHQFSGWVLWVFVVLFLARRHPPIPVESRLGPGRILLAVVAGVILLLSFMPHPLDIS